MRMNKDDLVATGGWGAGATALALTYTSHIPLILAAALPTAAAAYAASRFSAGTSKGLRTYLISTASLWGLALGDELVKWSDKNWGTNIVQRRENNMYEPKSAIQPSPPARPLETEQSSKDITFIETRDWKTFAIKSKKINTTVRGA